METCIKKGAIMRVRKRVITLGLCLGLCTSQTMIHLNNKAIANNIDYQLSSTDAFYLELKTTSPQPIAIEFTENANSNELNVGDRVSIRVASDIFLANQLIFKENAPGFLIVKSVKPSRNLGKGGYIIFNEGYIEDVNGMNRQVTFRKKISGENCKWAKVISHAMIWNPIGWIIAPIEGEPAYINIGDVGTCKTTKNFSF